ncbi:MAG: STM3941 family protein [Hyphomicrobiaceae bacterium]
MAIDTTRTIEIRHAPWRLIGVIGVGLCFVLLSIFIALAHEQIGRIIGGFGVAFFGFIVLIAAWRLLVLRGAVVTLSPRGIRDVRLTGALVPWSAIRSVSTWSAYNQPAIVLSVDPAYERGLKLTPLARVTRPLNAAIGADGLCVASQGLRMGHGALLETITAYWQRAQGDR